MIGLTRKQHEVLIFLCTYMDASGGISPTLEQIKVAIGSASKGHVHRLLGGLEYRGAIRRVHYRHQCIEILQRPDKLESPLACATITDLIEEIGRRALDADQCAALLNILEGTPAHA